MGARRPSTSPMAGFVSDGRLADLGLYRPTSPELYRHWRTIYPDRLEEQRVEEFRAWLGSSTAPSHPMIAPSPPKTPSTVRTPRHRRRAPIEPLPAPIMRLAEFLNAAASAEPPELEEWPRLLPTAEESSLRWSMPAEAPSFTRRSTLKPVKTVKRLSTLPLLSARDVPKPLPRERELAEARFGGELASFFDRIDEAYAYDAETSRLRRLGWGGKILRVKAAREAEVAQKAQEKAQAIELARVRAEDIRVAKPKSRGLVAAAPPPESPPPTLPPPTTSPLPAALSDPEERWERWEPTAPRTPKLPKSGTIMPSDQAAGPAEVHDPEPRVTVELKPRVTVELRRKPRLRLLLSGRLADAMEAAMAPLQTTQEGPYS